MFESRGILEHVARGVVGLGALTGALAMASTHPWLSAAAVVVGLIALRGWPMCWTIGLIQTVAARLRGTRTDNLCVKGQCFLDQNRGARNAVAVLSGSFTDGRSPHVTSDETAAGSGRAAFDNRRRVDRAVGVERKEL